MSDHKFRDIRESDGYIFNGYQIRDSKKYAHWLSPEAWRRKQEKRGSYTAKSREKRSLDPVRHAAANEYANQYAKTRRRSDPSGAMFSRIRMRAKRLGILFNLTIDDIHIPELCPVFGMPMAIGAGEMAPELDRIKRHLGYVRGNIIVVSRRANRLKSDATIDELARIVEFYRNM